MEHNDQMNTEEPMMEGTPPSPAPEAHQTNEEHSEGGHKTLMRLFGALIILIVILIAAAFVLDIIDTSYENEMIYVDDPFEDIEEDELQVEAVTSSSTELDAIESDLDSLDFDSLDEGV